VARVSPGLGDGGDLLAGFMNPVYYLFDHDELESGATPVVRYELPYGDETSLSPTKLAKLIESGGLLEFSHSLDAQIGGQLRAGFVITGLFEDSWDEAPLSRWFKPFLNTRATKIVGRPHAGHARATLKKS
jgi:hypothetical protein